MRLLRSISLNHVLFFSFCSVLFYTNRSRLIDRSQSVRFVPPHCSPDCSRKPTALRNSDTRALRSSLFPPLSLRHQKVYTSSSHPGHKPFIATFLARVWPTRFELVLVINIPASAPTTRAREIPLRPLL